MACLSPLQVKKLVYLYLVRYAEEQQDLALLSISTFQKGLKVDEKSLLFNSSHRTFILVCIFLCLLPGDFTMQHSGLMTINKSFVAGKNVIFDYPFKGILFLRYYVQGSKFPLTDCQCDQNSSTDNKILRTGH